jgi:hypothetical protein
MNMNKNQILTEMMSASDGNIITESYGVEKKDVFLHGIFMQAAQKNRNGRVYPLSEMVGAVASMNEHIKSYGGLFGELDHPADRLTIAMDRISHVITELYMDGNNVIGKAKLLDTPMGMIAKAIGNSGARYGVSSRGAGQVNEAGEVSGFRLVTIDLVATPSAAGAMPNTIYESLENYKNGTIITLAEAVRNDPAAQKYFKDEMRKFISVMFAK